MNKHSHLTPSGMLASGVKHILFYSPVSNVSSPPQRSSCRWPMMEAAVHRLQRAHLSTILTPAARDTCSPCPHLHMAYRRALRSMWSRAEQRLIKECIYTYLKVTK